jgi:hypothetical protein
MSLVHRTAFVVLLAAVPLLAGCAPTEPTPSASPTAAAASPSATAESTPEPQPVFVAPTTCADLIGPDLAAVFASRNIVVFDSTNGEGIYANGFEPAQDGGDPFACLFGQDMVDLSTFQLVVQPVSSEAEHEGIIAVLGSQNFTQSINGSTVTFIDEGTDTDPLPAIIHILKPDRWLTAYSYFGGEISASRLGEHLAAVDEHLSTD